MRFGRVEAFNVKYTYGDKGGDEWKRARTHTRASYNEYTHTCSNNT